MALAMAGLRWRMVVTWRAWPRTEAVKMAHRPRWGRAGRGGRALGGRTLFRLSLDYRFLRFGHSAASPWWEVRRLGQVSSGGAGLLAIKLLWDLASLTRRASHLTCARPRLRICLTS